MLLSFFSYRKKQEQQTLFRNFIFGVEDSLVSTVGLLSGVAVAGTTQTGIVTAGIVLIFVEAFSMGVGSFLSEETAAQSSKKKFSLNTVIKAALVMFISYFLAGFIPLTPYIVLEPLSAYKWSIVASLTALTILGIYSAKRFHGKIVKKAIEMLILGGLATLVGIAVGSLFGTT